MCIISYVAFSVWMGSGVTLFDFDFGLYAAVAAATITKWLIKVNRNRMLYTLIISHFSIEFEWAENCSVPKWKLRIHIMIVHPLIQAHDCRLDTRCTWLLLLRACVRALCVCVGFRCTGFWLSLYIVKSNVAKCTCFFSSSVHVPQCSIFACIYLF